MAVYAAVQEVRDEGVTVAQASDPRVTTLLELASRYIDRVTGLFFEKKTAQTYKLDGPGTVILELPAPALTLTSVKADNIIVTITDLVNYNRRPPEFDDYLWPRLEWRSELLRLERALGPLRKPVWPRGNQNIEVVGDFGYVEPDNTTPLLIKRACVLIVAHLAQPAASVAGREARRRHLLRSESIAGYGYTLAELATGGNLTGDPEVDGILTAFTRAPAMAAV